MNFDSAKSLRSCALRRDEEFREMLNTQFELTVPGYENRIGAFFKGAGSRKCLEYNLKDLSISKKMALTERLKARIRKII